MHMLGDRYEVHAVADGQLALDATEQLRPALVLTDVMMPRLDGFGLVRARQIFQDPKEKHTKDHLKGEFKIGRAS